ncbi:MAG: acyltransferase [Gammaproteobacteria bacterium]
MDYEDVAKNIAPFLAAYLLQIPRVWGDHTRVHSHTGCALNNTLFNTVSGDIYLEEYVFFGHNVCLLTGTHDITKTGRGRIEGHPTAGRDIRIHKGAWLASNVTVLGPCEIGENAVIAAGSLVIGDVPPNCIYAGTPAKFIKKIEFAT